MTRLIAILFALLVVAFAAPAAAQTPQVISVQGYLTDAEGQPLTGEETGTFTIYTADTAGDSVWTESVTFTVESGTFTALLGQTTPLDEGVFTASPNLWVEINLNGETLSPRLRLSSVPFAKVAEVAGTAESLQGLVPSDFVQTGSIDWADVNNVPSTVSGIGSLGCNAGEVPQYDGTAWTCVAERDTVADLGCAAGEVPLYDGTAWTCIAERDTLADLGCSSGEGAAWNGTAWTCVDFRSGLSTVATSGRFQDLAGIPTGLLDGDQDTLGGLICPDDAVIRYSGSLNRWQCGLDATLTSAEVFAILAGSNFVRTNQTGVVTSQMIADGTITTLDVATGGLAATDISGTAATLTGPQSFDNGTLYISSNNDRVGVNTPSPAARLDVNGNVRATQYDFATPKAGFVRVNATDFQPNGFNTDGFLQGYYWTINGTGPLLLIGSANVPTGAQPVALRCDIADFEATENIIYDVSYVRRSVTTGTTTTVASSSGTTSGSPGRIRLDVPFPTPPIAIVTNGLADFVRVQLRPENSAGTNSLTFDGCTVEYEATEASW